MPTVQIAAGCIVALIAVLSGVYVFFTAQCKGPILSMTYLLISKEERSAANKKAEYRFVTIAFTCISAMFAFLALQIFSSWKWPYIPMGIDIAFLLIYVIANSVKTENRK